MLGSPSISEEEAAHSILRERGPEDEARCVSTSSGLDMFRIPVFTSSARIEPGCSSSWIEEISLTLLVQKDERRASGEGTKERAGSIDIVRVSGDPDRCLQEWDLGGFIRSLFRMRPLRLKGSVRRGAV